MRFSRRVESFLPFLLCFVFWIVAFRSFLFNKTLLASDAIAYYEHFKFYIDNLSAGVFPLWDPTCNWGAPFEFFLRRIGSFNPLFLYILILVKIGVPYVYAYLSFLAVYFFIGMIGFYLTARHVLGDKQLAFMAFALLLFSALGSRLFDSYFLFTFIPMTWFFYFMLAFAGQPQKKSFLGMIFTLMILFTTYLPFYFVTIFAVCFLCCLLFYLKESTRFVLSLAGFMNKNKLFALVCLLALGVSMIPGYRLFLAASGETMSFQSKEEGKEQPAAQKEGGEKNVEAPAQTQVALPEFVLPMRNNDAPTGSVLKVNLKTVTKWAALEDIAFSSLYANLRDYTFAVVYFPIFLYLLLTAGVLTTVHKKFLFLFVLGGIIFLVASPNTVPLYQFLYETIPYFKYFRNLHFFLWIVVMPVVVLIAADQWGRLGLLRMERTLSRRAMQIFLVAAHLFWLGMEITSGGGLITSYASIGLSFFYFWFYLFKPDWLKRHARLSMGWLLALIILQPLQVFHHLAMNNDKVTPGGYGGRYRYDDPAYLKNHFTLPTESSLAGYVLSDKEVMEIVTGKDRQPREGRPYYGLRWFHFMFQNLHPKVYDIYKRSLFLVYDRVMLVEEEAPALPFIEQVFATQANMAFAATMPPEMQDEQVPPNAPARSRAVVQGDPTVQMFRYNVNRVALKTNFDAKKFLVYNDGYHSGWRAYIDGKKTPIHRANIGFKGVWVPQGEHEVVFRFGSTFDYALNYGLLVLFYGFFVWLIIFWKNHEDIIKKKNC